MENKLTYIGIKPKESNSNGNLNDIWEEFKEGWFKCTNNPNKDSLIVSKLEIEQDLKNQYLKIWKK